MNTLPPALARLAGLALVASLVGCGGGGSDSAPAPEGAPASASAVVTASGSAAQARIAYAVDSSSPTELTVNLPWTATVPLVQGQTLTVTATNPGTSGQVSLQVAGSEGGTVNSSGTSTATVRFSCCH